MLILVDTIRTKIGYIAHHVYAYMEGHIDGIVFLELLIYSQKKKC